MMHDRLIEYVDAVVAAPAPVRKKIWNGEQFIQVVHYKTSIPTQQQREWLYNTYGPAGSHLSGQHWQYNAAGDYMIMDEQVYTWFHTKWGRR